MSDFLIDLGMKSWARSALKKTGLPIPFPQKLKRTLAAAEERPIADRLVVTRHSEGGELAPVFARTLAEAGAKICFTGADRHFISYQEWGESAGRLPKRKIPAEERPFALAFDATGIKEPQELRPLYEFFHEFLPTLLPCGRAIIASRPSEQAENPVHAATLQALDGFMRSLAREIGKKGITAELVLVDKGAEERLTPVLRFLLSDRSAYITGQRLRVTSTVKQKEPVPFRRVLDGKVALVTGAARGIGAAIARSLFAEGARVICLDRPESDEALSKLAYEIKGEPLLCDITDPAASREVANLIESRFGGHLHAIAHNAGITRDKTLVKMGEDAWDQVLRVNLIALIALNEGLLPLVKEGGRIACISSVAGIAGNHGQTNYAAAKAGIIGYIRALAPRLAPQGIAINAVAPGFIETEMTAAIPRATKEVSRRLCDLMQGGQPEDVAHAVTFLLSPGASGLCGETLRVCGGNYLGV